MRKTVTKRFRCTPEEAARIEAMAGENFSEYVRGKLLGGSPIGGVHRAAMEKRAEESPAYRDALNRRAAELARTMPRSNAERLARKELNA